MKRIKNFCWLGKDGYVAIRALIFDFFEEKERLPLGEIMEKIRRLKENEDLDIYIYSGDRSKAADAITFMIDRLHLLEKRDESYGLSTEGRSLRRYINEEAFKRELFRLSYLKAEEKFSRFHLFLMELKKKYKLFGKMIQKTNLRNTMQNYGLLTGGNRYMLPYLVYLGVLKDAGIYYEVNPNLLLIIDELKYDIFEKILREAYESKVSQGRFFTYEEATATLVSHDLTKDEAIEVLKRLREKNVFIIHQSGDMRILRM